MKKIIFLTILCTPLNSMASSSESKELKRQEVARTIKGALVTLINMQIQDRPGRHSPNMIHAR